jgi:hypothetical protein
MKKKLHFAFIRFRKPGDGLSQVRPFTVKGFFAPTKKGGISPLVRSLPYISQIHSPICNRRIKFS